MSDRTLKSVVAALAAMLVVVLTATVLVMASRGDGVTAGASPTPSAPGSASSPSPAPTDTASPQPTDEPSPTETPVEPATPSPSAPSGEPAPSTLTLVDLKLDAMSDPSGANRVVIFHSDGPGMITAKLATTSPQGTTHMCLNVGSKEIGCQDWASGTFTGTTSQARAKWRVTLRGVDIDAPTVNLTVTFEAIAPSVTIRNARFDGTDYPETNGISARFTARTDGDARVVGSWGGHPFDYEIDAVDETSGGGDASYPAGEPSIGTDQAIPVTTGDWLVTLRNGDAGFGVTELDATISWP